MTRRLARTALISAVLLLFPLFAGQVSDEWSWGPGDFAMAFLLLFTAGSAYQLGAPLRPEGTYRVALAFIILVVLGIVWAHAAVGIL